MKNRLNIFIFLLLGTVLLSFNFTSAIESSDAIAIRILQNPNHYSPLRWYKENIKIPGSPQSLIVDGYDAIRDGRTVYVAAANIKPEGNNSALYTNIYVISFNQDAQVNTVDIFGQLLANWKFNINLSEPGVCNKKNNPCLSSNECPVGEYCTSDKAKVVREVKRFADLADINSALEKYKTKNGYCPKLASGSYLPNKSISTWPSWQQTLGKELGMTLPIDPINKLGRCKADEIENKKYDSNTCWDQHNVKLAFASDPKFIFPDKSYAYVYRASSDGKNCTVYSTQETDYFCPPGETCKGGEMLAEPQTCDSFTYNCGVCQPNNTKTCTVTASFPVNCVGGNPSLIQTCANPSPACNYTYDNWGPCQPGGTQTRTFTSTPVGCVGTPVTSQACTYTPPPPPPCNYTYDNWGPCQPDGTQTRTFTSTPVGCVGTPVTSQTCTISVCNNEVVESPEKCDFGLKNGTGTGCSTTCQPENNFACLAAANTCCIKSYTAAAKGVTSVSTGLPVQGAIINFYNDPNPSTARCSNGQLSASPALCNYNAAARGSVLAGSCTTDVNGDCTLASPLQAGSYIRTGPNFVSLSVVIVPFSVCYDKTGGTTIYTGQCTDVDNDGYGQVGLNAGCPFSGNDCNDGDKNINPGAAEICPNSIDENCNSSTTDCQNTPMVLSVISPINDGEVFEWGSNMNIKISGSSAIASAQIRIYNSAGSLFKNLTLFDDGAHNDGMSGDGVWGGDVLLFFPDNSYYFDAIVNGVNHTRVRDFSITNKPVCNTIVNNGSSADKLDIVYIADQYTSSQMSLFEGKVFNSYTHLFNLNPFSVQKSKINIHRINSAVNLGCTDPTLSQPNCNATYVSAIANICPVGKTLVVVNGGLFRSYAWPNGFAVISSADTRFVGVVAHELGHSFGGLADEYVSTDPDRGSSYVNGTINCDTSSACTKWIPSVAGTGCFTGCAYKNTYYRSVNLGIMGTATLGTDYGTLNINHMNTIFNNYYQ